MLLIDLIIFNKMFEISCVQFCIPNCILVFFHFEMCHTCVNFFLCYIFSLIPMYMINDEVFRMKAHYDDPFWGIFGSSIIVHTIYIFQKHGTFIFGYQIWFLNPTIIIFTKLMLCNFFNNKFHHLYWKIHEYIYTIHWYNKATVSFWLH